MHIVLEAFKYNMHRLAPKKLAHFVMYTLTSSNVDRLSNLFHFQNQQNFLITQSLKIPPHIQCVATLPCEMCLKSNIWKQDDFSNNTF